MSEQENNKEANPENNQPENNPNPEEEAKQENPPQESNEPQVEKPQEEQEQNPDNQQPQEEPVNQEQHEPENENQNQNTSEQNKVDQNPEEVQNQENPENQENQENQEQEQEQEQEQINQEEQKEDEQCITKRNQYIARDRSKFNQTGIEDIQKNIQERKKKIEHEKINLRITTERLTQKEKLYNELQGKPVAKTNEEKERERKEHKKAVKNHKLSDPIIRKKGKEKEFYDEQIRIQKIYDKNKLDFEKLTCDINE